jgi:hypothetical protein
MICLSIISLVVALDATILVPALPVSSSTQGTSNSHMLDNFESIERLSNHHLLGRNILSPH